MSSREALTEELKKYQTLLNSTRGLFATHLLSHRGETIPDCDRCGNLRLAIRVSKDTIQDIEQEIANAS